MAKTTNYHDLKTKILLSVLADVPFDGWTDELFLRAAKKTKLKEDVIRDAFPDGVTGLIQSFSCWANAETEKALAKKKLANMRVRDKVTLGVRTRLEILEPHKEAFGQALSYMARPPRSLYLPKMVWATADMIWTIAGDTATDYNKYTKRFLLSGVLSATAIYWLKDKSKGHEKTWGFLDQRIENVLTIGKTIGRIKEKTSRKKSAAA